MGALILAASIISVELGFSVAIIEIGLGIIGGNFLGLETTPWIDFLAGFASIVLMFLAGVEVDLPLMREKLKESLLIGGVSFLAPFLVVIAVGYWLLVWSREAPEVAGVALSTTSLAVVYAVLVETELTSTRIGKLIMAATFVTDFCTAAALSLLFMKPSWNTLTFVAVSALAVFLMPKLSPMFFRRYGDRVIEPEIKLICAVLFLLMLMGARGNSHAVLPAFVLGLAMSRIYAQHQLEQQRLRVVAFALLTPFFFIKGGMNVSLSLVGANIGLLLFLLATKMITKFAGVLPLARKYVRKDAAYTILLMSTGLTFGTISSLYGLEAGYIDQVQFSLLVTTVVLSAIVPTFIAQQWYRPHQPQEDAESSEAMPAPNRKELADVH